MLNYENLEKHNPMPANHYNIPEIRGVTDCDHVEWIPFNYAKTAKNQHEKGVHFFLDDYQFERLWNRPDTYLPMLAKFKCVMSPDFSLYSDTPKCIQIYNHYRKHWIASYLELHGIRVIPTICWAGEDSFEWCFDGEPVGGVVAVSTTGCMKNKVYKDAFMAGYEEMKRRLKPVKILCHGLVPPEISGEVERIPSFIDDLERRKKEWGGEEQLEE